MPGVTVASVLSEAQSVYLNDASAVTYTNAVLLPFVKTAYEHLRNELALNQVPTLNERSAAQTIALGGTALTTVPTDMLFPVKIEERTPSSSELYTEMQMRTWEPDEIQTSTLRFWTWREEAVAFLGATAAREIRVYYIQDLNPTAITAGSTLNAANARSYLAARVSALVAMFIQHNESLAQASQMVADDQLRKVVQIAVLNNQALPTRRKPFLGPRRLG